MFREKKLGKNECEQNNSQYGNHHIYLLSEFGLCCLRM